MRLHTEWRLAAAVPRWAWHLYRRRWPVIAGLSMVPSVQRLVVVNWDVPGPAAAASEVLVAVVRLALLVVVWRLAAPHGRLAWAHVRTFAKAHWPSLAIQGGLLMLAALIFDVGVESAGRWLPADAQRTYLAVVLFIKNPTIIAFTFVWLVGIVRQLSTADGPARRREVVVGE